MPNIVWALRRITRKPAHPPADPTLLLLQLRPRNNDSEWEICNKLYFTRKCGNLGVFFETGERYRPVEPKHQRQSRPQRLRLHRLQLQLLQVTHVVKQWSMWLNNLLTYLKKRRTTGNPRQRWQRRLQRSRSGGYDRLQGGRRLHFPKENRWVCQSTREL